MSLNKILKSKKVHNTNIYFRVVGILASFILSTILAIHKPNNTKKDINSSCVGKHIKNTVVIIPINEITRVSSLSTYCSWCR